MPDALPKAVMQPVKTIPATAAEVLMRKRFLFIFVSSIARALSSSFAIFRRAGGALFVSMELAEHYDDFSETPPFDQGA